MAAKPKYTYENLKDWPAEKVRNLYINAQKQLPEGQYIIDIIDNYGIPMSDGALSQNDPVYRRMVEIAWSPEGKAAAIEATKKGLPALCGVDPLFREHLGDQYHKHNMGTFSAGGAVAPVMRHLGYKEIGKGKCPDGCVARTGILWG